MALLNKQAKLIYWGTSGCGSRSSLGFFNEISEEGSWTWVNKGGRLRHDRTEGGAANHHKQVSIPGYEDYKVVYMVRNPYTRLISGFLDILRGDPNTDFGDYVRNKCDGGLGDWDWNFWEEWDETWLNKRGDYPIRMENAVEDWMSIPEVVETMGLDKIKEVAAATLLVNAQMGENIHDEYDENGHQVTNKWFTQELADIVYNDCKFVFDIGGYERDSWK
jgi:hypothetical protein